MKVHWFIRKGILFLPVSLMGWVVLCLAAMYAAYPFIEIDSRSHSVSDTLMNWVFNCLIISVVYSLIGFLTMKRGLRNSDQISDFFSFK